AQGFTRRSKCERTVVGLCHFVARSRRQRRNAGVLPLALRAGEAGHLFRDAIAGRVLLALLGLELLEIPQEMLLLRIKPQACEGAAALVVDVKVHSHVQAETGLAASQVA